MFDTLLASNVRSTPRVRSAAAAILLHLGIILGAVGGTATSPLSAPVVRDTFRLELGRPAPEAAGPLRRPAPTDPYPMMPEPPRPPDIQLRAPRLDLPRLDWHTPLDPAALSGAASVHHSSESFSPLDGSGTALPITEVDQLPELANDLRPRYPEALRQSGVSGSVQLEYVISTDGRVHPGSIRVLGSTHTAFAAAATEAVRRARFKPARRAGQPVAMLVQQTIRFLNP